MLIGSNPDKAKLVDDKSPETKVGISVLWFLFCGFGLVLFSNSINVVLTFGSLEESQGIGLLQIARLLTYTGVLGVSFYFLLIKKPILSAMGPVLFVLLLLAALSIFWSLSPKETFIRTYGLIGSTLLGVVMALLFSWKNFLRMSLYTYLVIILITVVFCVLIPSIGLHHGDAHSGAWRGAFGFKNVMGRMMLLGFVLSCFARKILEDREKTLAGVCIAATAILALLSTSMTAILSLILMAGAIFVLSLMQKSVAWRMIAIFSVVVGVLSVAMILILVDLNELAALFFETTGKDPTITGRTDIWANTIRVWLEKRPFFGFGYGGFWETAAGNHSVNWNMGNFVPPHAHNGILQITTELGILGLLLIVFYLLDNIKNIWKYAGRISDKTVIIPLVIFILLIILNAAEVNIFVQKNVIWIIFVYCAVRMRLDLKEAGPKKTNIRQLERT